MNSFKPCLGKAACRDDGVNCLSCGRSLEEINALRTAMEQLVDLAIEKDYNNIEEYSLYIANKLQKSIAYRKQQMQDSL